MLHSVATGIFIAEYYIKSAKWDKDIEEKAQTTETIKLEFKNDTPKN